MQSFVRGRDKFAPYVDTAGMRRRDLLTLAAFGLVAGAPGSAAAATPDGQLTWGVHVSLAPVWFDPADVSGIITPFMVLYALHDAMVKLMPGQSPAPSLAEAWSASEDGLTYDFTLRQGTLFHNGDSVTAEDVKFSFERYRGASHDLMASRVAGIRRRGSHRLRTTHVPADARDAPEKAARALRPGQPDQAPDFSRDGVDHCVRPIA